jgi:hypothetical protein
LTPSAAGARRINAGAAIDSAGKLPTGAAFSTPADLKRLLAKRKVDLARNLTERLMAYALGRHLEGYDEVVIDRLMARIAKDDYRVRTIITKSSPVTCLPTVPSKNEQPSHQAKQKYEYQSSLVYC